MLKTFRFRKNVVLEGFQDRSNFDIKFVNKK